MSSFFTQLASTFSRRTLLRLHKDKRARARMGWFLTILAVVLYEGVLIFFSMRELEAKFLVPLALVPVVLGAVVWYRRRKPVQASGPQTLHLHPEPEIEAPPPVEPTPEFLRELAELLLLHAALAHRAASEGFLKINGVPAGKEIVTRQNHLRVLRDANMPDRLGPTERDLILAPDGAWDDDTIDRASLLLEPVRVLRWLLQIDRKLPLVGEAPLIDFHLAAPLLEDPKQVFAAQTMVGIDDIRSARSGAEKIFYRCYSEGQKRGLYLDRSAEDAETAIFYAERLAGNEHEDILIGHIIVSRASDDEVRLAAAAALARIKLLRWVQERLYGNVPENAELTAFGWS